MAASARAWSSITASASYDWPALCTKPEKGPSLSSVARRIRHHVERDRGIRHSVVDGRGQALMLEREQAEHALDRARGRECVADHRLVRRHRQALRALAKHRRNREVLVLVVLRRAG